MLQHAAGQSLPALGQNHIEMRQQKLQAYLMKSWLGKTGSKVIILFSCSTQLSMKFFLLINVKMPTAVGILTFMSRKNSLICLSEPAKS